MDEVNKIAIKAAVLAGKAIMKIYDGDDFMVQTKSDDSPLTKADISANDVINSFLEGTSIPIISEENRQLDYEVRKNWSEYWVVDPLDGTKEFIKGNGEFTVNIARVQNGQPNFGVIYAPVLRHLYIGDTASNKSYKIELGEHHEIPKDLLQVKNEISPLDKSPDNSIKVVGSRSHMNDKTKEFIDDLNTSYESVEVVSKGSSLKFCMVAEGAAHVYPRFAPTMEWDTAAGQAICNAVGVKVISKETNLSLVYNKENLLNSHFIVGS